MVIATLQTERASLADMEAFAARNDWLLTLSRGNIRDYLTPTGICVRVLVDEDGSEVKNAETMIKRIGE